MKKLKTMTQKDITVMIYLHFSAIVLAQDFVSLYL